MKIDEILNEARRRGITLKPDGGQLVVRPWSKVDPEFERVLVENKPALLAVLESDRTGLTPDCYPWLHIARQIMAGEFDGADKSTIESLTIGLRHIEHQLCRDALKRIKTIDSGRCIN